MKRIFGMIMMLMAMVFTGCTDVKVGEIGVKVFLYGGGKGETEILGTGRYWIGWGEELFTYPTTQIQYSFTEDKAEGSLVDEAFRFTAQGGTQCIIDIGVIAYADPTKADILYKTYRKDMKEIIKTFVRQDIRDAVAKELGQLTVEEIYNGKDIDAMQRIEDTVRDKLSKVGLAINDINKLANVRFPKEINDSILAKIKSVQETLKIQNQLLEAEAQAKIKIVNAQAEQETNRLKMVSITPQLIEYEKIKNQALAIEKWNGVLPTTSIGNETQVLIGLK